MDYQEKFFLNNYKLYIGFPKEFENFVTYTRNLEFTEVPDYNYLRGLLKKVLKNSIDSQLIFFMTGVNKNRIQKVMI